jgi:hypothetical protein
VPAPSIVRCAKIATIETAEAARIGALPAALRAMVLRILAGMRATGQETMSGPD